jgi:hypothetical protein
MDARFRDLSHCAQFVSQNTVRDLRSWDYPYVNLASIEENPLGQWVAGEVDQPDFHERWILFQSGQFAHNRCLPDIPQLGNRVHYLEVVRVVSQAFEFARRMACEDVLSPEAAINVELHRVAGRGLVGPDPFRQDWCKKDDVIVERRVGAKDLTANSHDSAIDVAIAIFSDFGWGDAQRSVLEREQRRLR